MWTLKENNVELDQTPQKAASDLALHYFLRSDRPKKGKYGIALSESKLTNIYHRFCDPTNSTAQS